VLRASAPIIHGSGDLLVAGEDTVYRFSLSGTRSAFAGLHKPGPMAVGPDGSIWIAAPQQIARFSATGAALGATVLPAGCVSVIALASSPSGSMHFTAAGCEGVFAIAGGQAVRVIERPRLESLAFDSDGWLWVTDAFSGTVLLYDPQYRLVRDPFATGFYNSPVNLAFIRDADGRMTPRLLAAKGDGSLVEMNPAGMGAPGWSPIGLRVDSALRSGVVGGPYADTLRLTNSTGTVSWTILQGALPSGLTLHYASGEIAGTPTAAGLYPLTVQASGSGQNGLTTFALLILPRAGLPSADEVRNGLLGITPFTKPMERLIDFEGNKNGVLDAGDLRAYLRREGRLP
jgi:hypothetical protein